MLTDQKSLGVPSHTKGVITPASISIQRHGVSFRAGTSVNTWLMFSEHSMRNTTVAPNSVISMQTDTKTLARKKTLYY